MAWARGECGEVCTAFRQKTTLSLKYPACTKATLPNPASTTIARTRPARRLKSKYCAALVSRNRIKTPDNGSSIRCSMSGEARECLETVSPGMKNERKNTTPKNAMRGRLVLLNPTRLAVTSKASTPHRYVVSSLTGKTDRLKGKIT